MRAFLAIIVSCLLACGAQARELKVGIYALAPTQGSPFRQLANPSIYLNAAIFDALVTVAPGGAPEPALALSWERTAPTVWRFRLRPNVTFANGEVCDAEAVAATYRWLMDPANQAFAAANMLRNVKRVAVIDALTLEIETREPSASLANELSGVYIVPPRAFAATPETEFNVRPIGTGPFVVTAWTRGRVSLKANPTSWRAPQLTGLRYIEIPDESARLAALQSGAIDVAIQVSPDTFEEIESRGGRVLSAPSGAVYAIQFITEAAGSPFKDTRVRQALNYAVNKEPMAKVLFAGRTVASGQPGTRITEGHDPSISPYPHDPAKARALLAQAGYPNGFPLTIDVITSAVPADAAVFAAMARDLEAVGVKVAVRATPLAMWFQKYAANTFEGQAFQLGLSSMPEMSVLRAVEPFSCRKRTPPLYTCIPALEPLIDAAQAELDPAKRKAALQALSRAAHDEALALFLVEGADFVGLAPQVAEAEARTRFFRWDRFTLK